jgi:histidyl-tRNA synthetase
MGVERVLELMRANGEQAVRNECDVYLVHQGEAAQLQSFVLAERLRNAGLDVVLHCASSNAGGSFKSQMKRADASGAAYAIIIGDDEVANQTATVKTLRAEGDGDAEKTSAGNQSVVPFDAVSDYLVDQIVGAGDDHDHGDDHGHVHYHH